MEFAETVLFARFIVVGFVAYDACTYMHAYIHTHTHTNNIKQKYSFCHNCLTNAFLTNKHSQGSCHILPPTPPTRAYNCSSSQRMLPPHRCGRSLLQITKHFVVHPVMRRFISTALFCNNLTANSPSSKLRTHPQGIHPHTHTSRINSSIFAVVFATLHNLSFVRELSFFSHIHTHTHNIHKLADKFVFSSFSCPFCIVAIISPTYPQVSYTQVYTHTRHFPRSCPLLIVWPFCPSVRKVWRRGAVSDQIFAVKQNFGFAISVSLVPNTHVIMFFNFLLFFVCGEDF